MVQPVLAMAFSSLGERSCTFLLMRREGATNSDLSYLRRCQFLILQPLLFTGQGGLCWFPPRVFNKGDDLLIVSVQWLVLQVFLQLAALFPPFSIRGGLQSLLTSLSRWM